MTPSWLESAHPHLLLNHLPVVGAPCALLLLLAGSWFRSEHLKRAGLVASIFVALVALPAWWTGEPAEDALHGIPDVSGPRIEEHEESAGYALAVALLAGVVALGAIVISVRRGATPPAALLATTLLAALAVVILARTAWLGGPIRHSEIRDGAAGHEAR